jgi:hypothetical protein
VGLDYHCHGVSALRLQQRLLSDARTSDDGFQGAMVGTSAIEKSRSAKLLRLSVPPSSRE